MIQDSLLRIQDSGFVVLDFRLGVKAEQRAAHLETLGGVPTVRLWYLYPMWSIKLHWNPGLERLKK